MSPPDQFVNLEGESAGSGVERLVSRFIDACRGGEHPKLEDYLPAEVAKRSAALTALVRAELEHRLQAGEKTRVEEYLERHPELAERPRDVLDLLTAEYACRRLREPELGADEYCDRFPQFARELPMHLDAAGLPATDCVPSRSDLSTYRGAGGELPAIGGQDLIARAATLGYEIQGELGRGGMGIVYRAHDSRRKQDVALKTLQWVDPSALYRFKQEFRTLADVTHPNLVGLYDLVSDGRLWFFTMEFVDGVDFYSYVRGTRPGAQRTEGLSPAQLELVRNALGQLVSAIAALHEAGKLHRDIKHRNVLVTPEGRTVLLDFGLSADLGQTGMHHSTQDHLLGTVPYMSPEQAASSPVSPATDWYAVGTMLYEVLTGRLPFSGPALDVLQKKQTTDPPPPLAVMPGVPEDLDQLCVDLLRRDPQARPSGKQICERSHSGPRPLAESAAGQTARIPSLGMARGQFVGRQQHLSQLHGAFARLLEHATVIVNIEGSSGAGKSALARHFLDGLVEQQAAVVLTGRCYERESVPYKALDSLIDSLSRYLGKLPQVQAAALLPRDVASLVQVFPVLQRLAVIGELPQRAQLALDPQELRRRASRALRELFARLGDRQPLVLWIDDLQWGDTDSIALVAELLEPPDQPVFLLLGTYRSHEAQTNPFLGRFRQIQEQNAGHLERVDLSIEPLSREEANRLAFALLDRDDPAAPARAEAIARECRGNPLFVYELVDFVQSGAGLEAGSGREISLDAVLLARVKRLPEPARRLLETVVVAARPIREDLACQAAALSADGRSWLSILRTGRLIRGTLSRELVEIEVYHDRIRETIAAQLSSSDIKAYHQNLARVLEPAAGTDPESLAIHFAGAGLLRQAARYYALAAGNAARSLAFDHASELYRLALAYQHSDEPARLELQVALADALANAGRGAEAAGEYLLAAGNTPSNDQANLLRNNATFQFLASGHIDEGLATIRDVLQSVGAFYPRSPLRALGSMLVLRALLRLRGLGFRERSADQVSQAALTRIDALFVATKGLGIVDPMRASYFQSLGVLAALRAGEPLRIAHSLAQQAGYESVYGTRSKHRSAQVIDLAHKMAGRLGDPYISAFTTYVEGGKAYLEGRWKDALELCDKAEAMYRNHCTGVFWELDTTQTFSLWSLTYLGEIRLLSERRSVLLKSARERGDLFAATNFGTYIMSLARLGADDPEGAQRELDDVMRRWSQQGFHLQHHNAVLAQGYIDLYRGDGAAAWDHLAAKKPRYKQSLLSHVQHVRIDILQLRGRSAIAAAADGVDARAMLASARRIARQLTGERADWATALAVFIRACAAACESRSGEAVELLRWALQRFEAVDMNLFAAACRRRLGQLTGGSESRKKIEQADAWMARQGIKNPERMTAMMAPGFRD